MTRDWASAHPTPSDTKPGFKPIRLINPSREDLDAIQDRFDLHDLVVADLLEGRQHPKFERFDDYLYLTIWDISSTNDGDSGADSDLAMIISDDALLLVQGGRANDLRDLDALLAEPGHIPATSPISAVYRILDAIVHDFIELGAVVDSQLDEVEAEVFDSRVHEDFRRIYRLRQRIGRIDRAATGLADALRSGRQEFIAMTARETELHPYFIHLEHDANGVAKLVAAEHAALGAAVSSHQSNVSSRQNQDTRTISAFAALLAIPTVIAGIYGMNFKNLPLVQWEFGWVAIAAAIVVLDALAYFMFRRRGWLGGGPGTRRDGDND